MSEEKTQKEGENVESVENVEVVESANDAKTTDSNTAEEKTEEAPAAKKKKVLPYQDLVSGMVVKVHEKIKDTNSKGQERERVQIFEGIIMGVKGAGISRTMTVRKNSDGVMVEKIYPLSSPNLEKIEIVKRYRTRRAKINFLRGRFKRKMQEIK